eukprot:762494-Hanusia_phi.AAC.3
MKELSTPGEMTTMYMLPMLMATMVTLVLEMSMKTMMMENITMILLTVWKEFGLFKQKLRIEYFRKFRETVPATDTQPARGVDHIFVQQGCYEVPELQISSRIGRTWEEEGAGEGGVAGVAGAGGAAGEGDLILHGSATGCTGTTTT